MTPPESTQPEPPPSTPPRFHVARDGEVMGEFSEAEFASKVRRLEIRSTDHFFVEGMKEWLPVYEYRPSVKLAPTPTPESIRAQRREKLSE